MALDPSAFETTVPSRYITFTLPNPLLHLNHFTATLLRIAVIDSPSGATAQTTIAAMLVPPFRESDWTFSTESGHLQLILAFPHLSRLVLIGNCPDSPRATSHKPPSPTDDTSGIEDALMPLMIALCPKEAFRRTGGGLPRIPFLNYEDKVIQIRVLETCFGNRVGEIAVEDVELEAENGSREFRRRLRFKRTPNLIQTQIRIHPESLDFENLEAMKFQTDNRVLVHPYLTPMVAGLSVIASHLDGLIRTGIRPKALCLGVGGGALLSFLNSQLGFEVVGVEEDDRVLEMARKYFGLEEDGESIRLCVGDGMDMIRKLYTGAGKIQNHDLSNAKDFGVKFDAIMVDLDSACAGAGTSAPPPEFVHKPTLSAAKRLLSEHGVIIVNVMPLCEQFYETLMSKFRDVFGELYEIDVADDENVVVIATASKIRRDSGGSGKSFLSKLDCVIQGSYLGSIRAVSSVVR
ncbi:unnamed protein product [Cuscuta campestris]|uniref:PABS domain-containing protein n=1 Tax=Cuscuta campestris TaxID=132261 RepID=A0A484MTX7_9ASTE|nr:unnamed protein product [Cuscuta campestris]VFQ91251.1 unnamed protein product [Cuscuta campestris]